MRKADVPDTVPSFWEGHTVTLAVTVTSGAISALALGHHVQEALTWTGWTKVAAVALASAFAFLTAMTPISLARAHGESMEGGNPQSALLVIVLMLVVVDGALQIHAVQYIVNRWAWQNWQCGRCVSSLGCGNWPCFLCGARSRRLRKKSGT